MCAKYDRSDFNNSWKIDFSLFFPHTCIGKSIWPLCREVKHQPWTIIWTNFGGLKVLMLYTKFQDSKFVGSWEEDFSRVFTIYGHGGRPVQQTESISIYSCCPRCQEAKYQIWFQLANGLQRRRCLKMLMNDRCLTIL